MPQVHLKEAAHLYERALHVREQLLGELHQDTAQSLNNLGLLLIFLGRYAEALAYLLRAAHIRQHLPYIGPKLAITLNNVGYALSQDGSLRRGTPVPRTRTCHA